MLIGGIAGLLPDLDVPLQWMATRVIGETVTLHRLITHSLVFVGLFLLIAFFFHSNKRNKIILFNQKISYEHIALFFVVIAAGWFTHILLDCAVAGDYRLTFFPGYPLNFCPQPWSKDSLLSLDAIILVLWLIHEEWARKIKDFI